MTAQAHMPNLETVLMVERAIMESQDYPTKTELWKSLERKVEYPTFKIILDYLEASNKIIYKDRKIVWVFADNPKLKELLTNSVKLR